MKKIFLVLACLIALVLPSSTSACEYESQLFSAGIVYYGYRPVITGVNAADNLVASWAFDSESIMKEIGEFHYVDPNYTITTTFYYRQYRNAISLVRRDPGPVHFPLTVYVSLLGCGNADTFASLQLPKVPLPDYIDSSRLSNYTENIQSVELQYRIYPATTWISAGVQRDFYSFPNYDAIVSASLPDNNNFSIISNKARACYGRYTIDPGIVPQGALVQLRLVTTYDNPTYWFESKHVMQAVSSRETKSSPSSYYAVVPTVIGATDGDWVTVTASGKRRPLHDQ